MTGNDFINGTTSYCLWLSEANPPELRDMPKVMERVARVKKFREESKSSQKFATTPWLYRETVLPQKYLLIPKTSSERRQFFPLGFVQNVVVTNSALYLGNASLYHFGILTSTMHNAWLRAVCGRLKSDFRYSAAIVYNNFPWPDLPGSCKQNSPPDQAKQAQAAIESAAQAVLDIRAKYQQPADPTQKPATLADLYDPLSMPPDLLKAHQRLDAAVDAAHALCGGKKKWSSEPERVAFLFARYQQLTSLLPAEKPKGKRKTPAAHS